MRDIPCDHKWIPLINPQLGCGSLGSQIGYSCLECGKQDIRWPLGAANTIGLNENILLRLNQKMTRS